MTKNRVIHKKLVCVVTVCGVLMMVACAPKNNGGTGNEVLVETEVAGNQDLDVETLEQTEIADGEDAETVLAESDETEVETQVQESESEYFVTEFEAIKYATVAVNVRKGPDTTYEKLETLTMNQEVKVTGVCDENNWYQVEYNGVIGFVSSEYLADEKVSSWVVDLDVAETASQMIVVAADGSDANVSMHIKEKDGIWTEILSTVGKIGRNGMGKTKEGDGKTPTGVYRFLFGFGNMPDPGCGLNYTQVDDSYYWVDDSDSAYYNQFVSTDDVTKDWDSAEHIAGVKNSYNYVLALDYNVDCVPEKGSAIFMHCTPTSGAGCIALSKEMMVEIMRNVKDGCVVVIDSVESVIEY